MSIDQALFRKVAGRFATGVTVVTTVVDGHPHGMTANAFTSVSLDPSLVLICVERLARTSDYVLAAGAFAVNILAVDQVALSVYFAGPRDDNDELAAFAHHPGATGSPILGGTVGYLDCRLTASVPAGDHLIFVGEVVDAAFVAEREPLVFEGGRYRRLTAADLAGAAVRPSGHTS